MIPLLWTSTRNWQTYEINSRNWNLILLLVKHRYWKNEQYSRTGCLEISDVPHNISQNDLEGKVCDIFCECDSDIDPVNIEACDCLKSNHWPNEVIVKLAKKNDALKILRGKNKLKTTDLSKKGFPPNTIFFINESLCSHYRFLCSECKNYGPKNPSKNEKTFFNPFDLKKVKTPPQYWFHISKSLVKRFNIDMPLHMGTKKNSNFPSNLLCFYYCSRIYISCVYLYYYPIFVSSFCLPEFWWIKSTSFFQLSLP